MSLNTHTVQHTVSVFRKSTNTNSFGLTGYWVIESTPADGRHRVWSFATSLDLSIGEQALPFFTDSTGAPRCPAFEIPNLEGSVDKAKYGEFVDEFCR